MKTTHLFLILLTFITLSCSEDDNALEPIDNCLYSTNWSNGYGNKEGFLFLTYNSQVQLSNFASGDMVQMQHDEYAMNTIYGIKQVIEVGDNYIVVSVYYDQYIAELEELGSIYNDNLNSTYGRTIKITKLCLENII